MKRIQIPLPDDIETDAKIFELAMNTALDHDPDGYWEISAKFTSDPEIENRKAVFHFSSPMDPESEQELEIIIADTQYWDLDQG